MPNREDRILLIKGQMHFDIRSIFFSGEKRVYMVTYNNGRTYPYRESDVVYLTHGEDLPMPVRVTRTCDGMVFRNVIGVTCFVDGKGRTGAYRVVFENGDHKDYLSSGLRVEKHVEGDKAKNILNYLKDLSRFSRISSPDEDLTISLSQKYDRLEMVCEGSPLADYLQGVIGGGNNVSTSGAGQMRPIFPFGCNRSQYKAVCEALGSKMSVIQGPPGTGKTQTILNIVANLVIAGKSMEIVSNNNSAVLNVIKKLQKDSYRLDWLAAYLGNSANKSAFYGAQTGQYPDLADWRCDDLPALGREITSLTESLQKEYVDMERLSQLREELRQLETQQPHVGGEREATDNPKLRRIKGSADVLNLMNAIGSQMDRRGRLGLLIRLRLWWLGLSGPTESVSILERLYYKVRMREIEVEIGSKSPDVAETRRKESRLEELSLSYLHGKIYERYSPEGGPRTIFNQRQVEKDNPTPFLKEYPIVLSTTFSATTNICASTPFDYLIMDEASQVDVSSGALALSCARNAVIVGDEKQLPNVVTQDDRIAAEMLIRSYDIPSAYEFTGNSFLGSLGRVFGESIPTTMLREHYRCAPAIIGFCNSQFYDGQLIAMTTEGEFPSMRIATTGEGNFARGTVNLRQAEMIAREIVPEVLERFGDIGIIAPYNDQVRSIQSELRREGVEGIPVATVHKFQGRENDVIILSTVDNTVRSFVDDPHLLNVAVSRARKLFILAVSGNEQPESNIRDLIGYISYHNGDVFETSLRSVFDLLYKQMEERRKEFLSRHRNVSRFSSENILFALLEDILREERYRRLDILNNYPLGNLVGPDAPLDGKERAFAHRTWTHLDFLLFDKVTRRPVMAIEVDGSAFHFEGSDQSRRDALKDSVLRKIGLPLLRLGTDGSSERERITGMLDSILRG